MGRDWCVGNEIFQFFTFSSVSLITLLVSFDGMMMPFARKTVHVSESESSGLGLEYRYCYSQRRS